VLLILALVGVVGLAAVGVAVYYGYKFAEEKIKTSEAYTVAIAALKADPEVAEKMGTIKETGFPLGNFQENADGTGAAAYRVSVVGTKAQGTYTVVMTRQQRRWQLVSGKVTLAGGDVINIKSADEGLLTGGSPDARGDVPPPPPPPGKGAQGTVVSGGVLNGKAISKPEPAYPAVAKAARVSGTVTLADGDVINIKSADEGLLTGDNPDASGNVPPPTPPVPGKGAQGTVVSGGVLNGKAISKPDPAYPAIAKAAHASGTVTVAITVDETGKVISARAVSGHPLLQQAAVQAAYQARFTPTLQAGRPVKVSGVISYNFVPQ
jgi:protein TonB